MAKWIKEAVSEGKGALHRHLHVPPGEKIPASKLEEAKHSKNPKIRKEAILAETLKGFHHTKKKTSLRDKLYGSLPEKG